MPKKSLAAAAILALLAAAPANAADVLRVQLNADIRSLDPGVNRDDNTDVVMLHMVEGLVAYGADAAVRPLLAEKVDRSADGLTYTFRLRSGLTFHNGAPVTAADVVWSWNRYMDPKTKWRCLDEFDGRGRAKVVSVETTDPATVVFKLDKPNALFLAGLARTDCGMTGILHPSSVKTDGSFDKPVGTGPFMFGEWKKGESVRLDKFAAYTSLPAGKLDGYTGPKRPLVDSVLFRVIPDEATAKAAMLRGDIDLIPDAGNADVPEYRKTAGLKVTISPTPSTVTLLMQTRDPVLSNVKLRRAIAAAVDMNELVTAVTAGLAKPNGSWVPSISSYYSPAQAQGYAYDPALARKLIAEAGYKGEPIVIVTNKRYSSSYDSAVITQAMLQAVGLNATLEVIEWATQLDRYGSGAYQIMAFPYSARLDPALGFDAFMGAKDKQPRKVWDNPEAQALLNRSMVEADPSVRQTLFDDLHARFMADVPMLMLYNGPEVGVAGKRVDGYAASIFGKPRLWEVRLTP